MEKNMKNHLTDKMATFLLNVVDPEHGTIMRVNQDGTVIFKSSGYVVPYPISAVEYFNKPSVLNVSAWIEYNLERIEQNKEFYIMLRQQDNSFILMLVVDYENDFDNAIRASRVFGTFTLNVSNLNEV